MATNRQPALNIVQVIDGESAAELQIIQNKVIENIEKGAVSVKLKNVDLSGDPNAGSVEAKRFKNSASKNYGAARTALAGEAVEEDKVLILLDKDKEIVEELEKKDIDAYGVPGLIQRRSANHARSLVRELDRAFFLEAYNEGNAFSPIGASLTASQELEQLIVKLETVENSFVDGVDREEIALTLSVQKHSDLRLQIDELPTGHILTNVGAVGLYHGVPVFVSNRMPAGVEAMVMVFGSVAQPVLFEDYFVEKAPYTNAYVVELFYTYGTKAVTPDLIFYIEKEEDDGDGENGEAGETPEPTTSDVPYTADGEITEIDPATVTFETNKFIVPLAVESFTFKDNNVLKTATYNSGEEQWAFA